MAQSALDQLANAYLAAEGACLGDPRIKAGVKLEINGIGTKYSGTYRVAKAVHAIIRRRRLHHHVLELGRRAHAARPDRWRQRRPDSIDSIVVGLVTNNNDPDKHGRVKIKFPSLTEQESFWAPVLLPAAGKERGISMLPVPDEQVLVAFENGDPSFPYVLGSVFNGKDKPGDEMAVQDGSFAMKSDHKALIAAQEDITLRTEKGKWVIEVNGGEITETVKSPGNYTGTFDGKYGLTANQAITVESKQGVTIKAPQISLEAQGTMAIKGATALGPGRRPARAQGCAGLRQRLRDGRHLGRPHQHRIGSESAMTELLGSGLSFPLTVDRRGGIALATGEQDVDQAIEIILSTAPGERPMRPEFGCGVHDFVFDTIDAATVGRLETEVRSALDRWEPRISVEEVDFDLSRMGDGQLLINIGYRLRATNNKRNLVYPFYVIPEEEEAE